MDSAGDAVEKVEEKGEKEPPIMKHVRMVLSLMGCGLVSRQELEEILAQKGRQHRMAHRRRVDYIVDQLNKGPP